MKDIVVYIGLIAVGLIIGNYLPSYAKEKGKNLATKEDIANLTKLTEEVKSGFQKELGEFSKKIEFKYRFAEEQLMNLYSSLYAIISQSEYLRYFANHYDNMDFPFDKAPFLEMTKSIHKIKLNIGNGKVIKDEIIKEENEITKSNKIKIANEIIENSKYASKKLLKLAVAYRYVYNEYSNGNKDPLNEKYKYNIEEVKLSGAIIVLIIKEYNKLAKKLNLEYSEYELENGMFEKGDFDVSDIFVFNDEPINNVN